MIALELIAIEMRSEDGMKVIELRTEITMQQALAKKEKIENKDDRLSTLVCGISTMSAGKKRTKIAR